MLIVGKNLINFKTCEVNSHNSCDKLFATSLTDLFQYFSSSSNIKENTVFTSVNLQDANSENEVLVFLEPRAQEKLENNYSLDINSGKMIAPKIYYNVTFVVSHCGKKFVIAAYNKELNVLLINSFVSEAMSFTYFDYFAACLKHYNYTGNINFTVEPVKSENITVGIDGELEPVDKAFLSPYSLRDVPEEDLGCVKMSVETEDKIGIDNGYGQMEIRPSAGSPDDVVNDIKSLMNELSISKYHISTKGNRFPLGCHVHFGAGFPIAPPKQLLQLIDFFIGRKVMGLSGESRGHFAELSAWRAKAHGFEYRSMPSAIMENPTILKNVLTICLEVIKAFNSEKSFNITSNCPTLSDYEKINIGKDIVANIDSFIETYHKTTYAINTIAAWTNETK